MAGATPTWTYVAAWDRAAKALGVEIEGATRIELSPGIVLQAEMLVRGFGARRGTLVFRDTTQSPSVFEPLHEKGLTASSWEPYPEGKEANVGELLEVLGDWGWCGEGPAPAWLLTVDAHGWSSPADFYDALLPQLRAPEWHGRNLDALWDSVAGGAINGLEPPFALRVFNTEHLPAPMVSFMGKVEAIFRDAAEAGVPVALHVWP
jgi:RNAse (barnase) inhibitor barstar